MSSTNVNTSLYHEVRYAFIRRGLTLNAWCKSSSYSRQYVEKCLKFQRNGPKAYEVRNVVAKAAGLTNYVDVGTMSGAA